MKYITILDFERGEIHSFPYKREYGEDFHDIIEGIEKDLQQVFDFSESNCQWMIQDSLKFQIH